MEEHIRTFKKLCDSLAAIGKPVSDSEKVFCLLTSLGPQYENFTTTMLKPPRPSYSELVSQLQNFDQRRNWFSSYTDMTNSQSSQQLAFYGQQQQQHHRSSQQPFSRNSYSFSSNGRGFQAQQSRDQNRRITPTQQRRPPPPGEHRMTQTKETFIARTSANIVVQWATLLKFAGGYLSKKLLMIVKFHKHWQPLH